MTKTLSLIFSCAISVIAYTQDVPPLPELPTDSSYEDFSSGTMETIDQIAARVLAYTDDVDRYSSLGWKDWNGRIREWYDTVVEVVPLYPPMPGGVRFYLGKGIEEVSGPFSHIVSNVEPVYFEGIPTWTVRITEELEEGGGRFFQTTVATSICHQLPVDLYFDPRAWTLAAYGEGEERKLPAWIANSDTETIEHWYEERGRERFAFILTLVPQGELQNYQAKLNEKRQAEQTKDQAAPVSENNAPLRFTKIDVDLGTVLLDYYNATSCRLGLITARELTQPTWDFFGEVDSSVYAQVRIPLREDDDSNLHFFQLLDIGTDTDGDGLADTLEKHLYKTDPTKSDSSGSGISDWEKIFIYGLDPNIQDSDGDGLTDGEELQLATNPTNKDTDVDGLSDLAEHYTIRKYENSTESVKWVESDSWTELLAIKDNATTDTTLYSDIPLGFSLTLDRNTFSTCCIDANGRLILNVDGSDENVYSDNSNSRFEGNYFEYETHPIVAGYWDDLIFDTNFNSSIRYTTQQQNGINYFVVEYNNARLYSNREDESGTSQLSFQIIIEQRSIAEDDAQYIYTSYKSVGTNATGGSATIGVQLPVLKRNYQYSYNIPDAITSNSTISFALGEMTNPCNPDTDGDGLTDYDEVFIYPTDPLLADTDGDALSDFEELTRTSTDPCNADSDNDTLPDGWEEQYGLSPHISTESNGPRGDQDNDGLLNEREFLVNTNPTSGDTDADTLFDAMECGGYIIQTLQSGSSTPLTNVTSVLGMTTARDDAVITIPISPNITLQGIKYTDLIVDINGVVYLRPEGVDTTQFYSNYSNKNLNNKDDRTNEMLIISAYWDDLRFYNEASGLDVGAVTYNGVNSITVEYKNISIRGESDDTKLMTMRVIIPRDNSNRVICQYLSVHELFDASSATLGVKQPDARFAIQYSFNSAQSISSTEIIYTLGTQTDPTNADMDADGLTDAHEITLGTTPYLSDTDGDGLTDSEEVNIYLTNPTVLDSDGDGWSDSLEIQYGLPPNDNGSINPSSAPTGDYDGDGLSNVTEIEQGLNPTHSDTDGDGINDATEISLGTNPKHIDSDGDGMNDGWESQYGFSPLVDNADETHSQYVANKAPDADLDNDGVTNLDESLYNTDPMNIDSDGDGVRDDVEIEQGSDPSNPADSTSTEASLTQEVAFKIDGDYAAWEMLIEGIGESDDSPDTRKLRMHMVDANVEKEQTFTLKKGNSYRVSMKWLKTKEGLDIDWYCWSAQINGSPTEQTFNSYDATRREDVAILAFGEGYWAENDDGLLCAHTHMDENRGGNVAEGLTAMLHLLDFNSGFIPNYVAGDGITGEDVAKQGTVFNLWINDDDDKRSQQYSEADEDVPSTGTNGKNSKIDGVCDLLDFFPVHLDIQDILTFFDSHPAIKRLYDEGEFTLRLSHEDEAVRVVWTSLTKATANAYQTENFSACGEELNSTLLDAESHLVLDGDGIQIPQKFIEHCKASSNNGIFLIEGVSASTKPLKLSLYYNEDVFLWSTELPLQIVPVENLYTRINIRGMQAPTSVPAHSNHDTTLPNVLFLHGFNVSETDARGWHSEIFKRLYQSGTKMNFFGITWRGDEALAETIGFPALHYHLNVYNAFNTAPAFATTVANLPTASESVILAHSLGNLVITQAISEHGLRPDTYVLLNAAIPSEAFNPALQSAEANQLTLVPQDWREYDSRTYASRWNELFSASEPQSKMTWKGLFADIATKSPNTTFYNYFSVGDEVFELKPDIDSNVFGAAYSGILSWEENEDGDTWWERLKKIVPDATFERYAWQKQEFLKGTDVIFGTADGGWLFNLCQYDATTNSYFPYTSETANQMITQEEGRQTLRPKPVFSPTDEMLNPSSNIATQKNERYEILAYRILALSPATGTQVVFSNSFASQAYDVQLRALTSWGRPVTGLRNRWLHSDIKNMAYFYIADVFSEIRNLILPNLNEE